MKQPYTPTCLGSPTYSRLGRLTLCWVITVGLLGLSACASGLLPKAPAASTQLSLDRGDNLAQPAATGLPTAPQRNADLASTKTLVVEPMRADAGYDTRNMAYRQQAGQVAYFARHQWVDTPARMLTPLMVRALDASSAFRAVVVAPSTAVGQLRLETTLVRLEQDFSQVPSRARLTLRAVMIDTASRQALGTRTWDVRVDSTHDDPTHGALAASQATQSVMSQLADFCAEAASTQTEKTQ